MILVVEDNMDDSFLLTRELVKAGLQNEVNIIADGERALDYLLHASPVPKALFLDLKLPRLSGVELLQRIREEPRLYGLPVVIMTGSLDPKDAEKCARLGITAYLAKPVSLSIFKKIIATGRSRRSFLPRPVDPHFADVAMLH